MSSHDDLEVALEHAERMLASFDRATRELRTLHTIRDYGMSAAIAVAALILAIATGAPSEWALDFGSLVAVMPLVIAFGLLFMFRPMAKSLRRQRERDLAGLVQLSRVVRDLLPVVARNENWSELRQLTMRARIGRFPISEESR